METARTDDRAQPPEGFANLYRHGFLRAAVAAPRVHIADPARNVEEALAVARRADAEGAALLLLPELGLTGYAIDDLHHQSAVLEAAEAAVLRLAAESASLRPVIVAGAPLRVAGRVHNCGVALHRGRVLGAVPKSYLPNYREFYEHRWFAPAADAMADEIRLGRLTAPFGTDLLFACEDLPDFMLALEVCEDVWTPIPPSARACMAGATVVANLSASNVTVGKSATRHGLCGTTSARQLCAYLYSAAGQGESTTDLAWDGQAMVYENGQLLCEAERFAEEPPLIFADLDLDLLQAERARMGSFADCAAAERPARPFRRVPFRLEPPSGDLGFRRRLRRFPFVPDEPERLDQLCYEAYWIQAEGLRQRLAATGIGKVVIGVSGGLDSTQALLVAVEAMDGLGRPRSDILAYTLPAFATSSGTKSNAWDLMRSLGVAAEEVDMTPASQRMLEDLGHPAARGEPVYDVAFENVQAGARTSFLFRKANQTGGLVLGTGDLSEQALGWATYGVGDQMSHYNVNASAPKTLIQHLIRWVADRERFGAECSAVLRRILDTAISPELVPGEGDEPGQRTEDKVGPYALQDFNLFHISRFGARPSKALFLAWRAWRDTEAGFWPPNLPEADRRAYDFAECERWLRVFLHRFFATSQFKRSAMPNGPKISSGGSLSPRGDWRAPSDGNARAWLEELDRALGRER